ncbi:MAG TPA: SDR family NAD(P)-dependent oxidoreductase [Bryobacteraceae bacterium]|nr:SDR family NAD(P)-dependent oxidoreductase [Bryobacteraceae bacterium]
MQIREKIVLITGASEGIGAACAAEFRSRGARLSLTARSADKLALAAAGEAVLTAGDLKAPAVRRSAVERTLAAYGRIDILINNAGVGLYQPAHAAPLDSVREMFELNFFAALDMIQLVVPSMTSQRSGCIVNVGSIAGKVTLPWFTVYSASKYAIGALTDGLRMELASSGIHAMTVCPGYVKTGFQKHVIAGTPPDLVGQNKRWAITPEKCAFDIAQGVERNARTVVTPSIGWLLIALERMFPSMVDRRLESIYHKQAAGE